MAILRCSIYACCGAIPIPSAGERMETSVLQEQPRAMAEMPFSLEGRTALVTGAGRGIGRAIAKRLAAAGARVMASDLDEAMLRESEAECARPEQMKHFCGDLTDPNTPAALVQATLDSFGSVDIIVNNAGYSWDNVI